MKDDAVTFTLKREGDYLRPVVVCDLCGGEASSSGFQLWRPEPENRAPTRSTSAQVCGEECLEAWITERDDGDDWLALPLDAHLANLITMLDIDVQSVLAREQAIWAAEHTRHESPD